LPAVFDTLYHPYILFAAFSAQISVEPWIAAKAKPPVLKKKSSTHFFIGCPSGGYWSEYFFFKSLVRNPAHSGEDVMKKPGRHQPTLDF